MGVHGGLANTDLALVRVAGGFLIDFLDNHPPVIHRLLLEENRGGKILLVHFLAQKFIPFLRRSGNDGLEAGSWHIEQHVFVDCGDFFLLRRTIGLLVCLVGQAARHQLFPRGVVHGLPMTHSNIGYEIAIGVEGGEAAG